MASNCVTKQCMGILYHSLAVDYHLNSRSRAGIARKKVAMSTHSKEPRVPESGLRLPEGNRVFIR